MKSIAKYHFTAEIVMEYSARATADRMGKANCTMELFLSEDRKRGEIEWIATYIKPAKDRLGFPVEEDVEHIGLTFDDRGNLEDYDGIMSLPREAVTFLRQQGFKVGPDFIDYEGDKP